MKPGSKKYKRDLENILAVILGGGRGTRLYPLTRDRAKPAVPIAGKYRLIDIPLSNCINSGIYHIAVLTQFNSVSLHRHLIRTYQLDAFHKGWVQVWAAEQTLSSVAWYQGTADAVRKQLTEIKSANLPYVLILAGDHLYRMDYSELAEFHWEHDAEVTIPVQPVGREATGRLGILKRDGNYRMTDFAEKTTDPKILERMVTRDDALRPYVASMGIYLFDIDVLVDILENTTFDDFGGDIIPQTIHTRRVYAYDFDDYWEDIGTIRTFYDTNLLLTDPCPPFSFYDPEKPIYSDPELLPGSNICNSMIKNALIGPGCRITNATIENSVIGLRSQVRSGSTIRNTILMGADYYERLDCQLTEPVDLPLIGIGEDCHIEGALIDKNARISNSTQIRPFPQGINIDERDWYVRDGIVVIPKNVTLPEGTRIVPREA